MSFYNDSGSEYNILNSSFPHKTNKWKEKQKILYLLSFFFFFFSKVNSYPLFYNHKSLVNVTKNILGKMKDNIDAAKQILV